MEMYFSGYIFQIHKHLMRKDKIWGEKLYGSSVLSSFLSVRYSHIHNLLSFAESLTDTLSVLEMYVLDMRNQRCQN